VKRRDVLYSIVSLLGIGAVAPSVAWSAAGSAPHFGPPQPFDFDQLTERARALAAAPYQAPGAMQKLDYDTHWQIQYRDDAALEPAGPDAPIKLFYPGSFFPEPVRIHVLEDGTAREVLFSMDYFAVPDGHPAASRPEGAGFAGFRVMRPGLKPDWVSFLGASYFRTDGPEGQYGLSARGIAVDTGLPKGEEFPRFSVFWIGPPSDPADDLEVFALLEGPSVAGAYKVGLRREADRPGSLTTVTARLFLRHGVERLGIAPLTSMYWYSERDRVMFDEWRPEIHDSDGLAIQTGAGERIWRPLQNSRTIRTSSFFDTNPRGFGLIQRDRSFDHYQDDSFFYEKRPSAWIEPQGDWGEGAVQLVEIPTSDETFDNIVAYWLPNRQLNDGEALEYSYRIYWTASDPQTADVARVVATWQGQGGYPGQHIAEGVDKMVVDFRGPSLNGFRQDAGETGEIEPVVEIRGGEIVGRAAIRPVVGTDRWRLSFDFRLTGPQPADLRAWVRHGETALTETWITQSTTDRME
jgi:periplasmic glucans biosynthesis protein